MITTSKGTTPRARMQRSAWSATGSCPRTRSGAEPWPFFSRPKPRSTAPRPRYSSRQRFVSRGTRGWRRSALIQVEAGWHSAVGLRHLVALRLKSVPANVRQTLLVPAHRPLLVPPLVYVMNPMLAPKLDSELNPG